MENTNCIEELQSIQLALNELRNRNLLHKDKLSESLSLEVSPEFVEKAEWYQQCFLETDQVIDLLRHELATLSEQLQRESRTADNSTQCAKLKTDVQKLARSANETYRSFREFLPWEPAD